MQTRGRPHRLGGWHRSPGDASTRRPLLEALASTALKVKHENVWAQCNFHVPPPIPPLLLPVVVVVTAVSELISIIKLNKWGAKRLTDVVPSAGKEPTATPLDDYPFFLLNYDNFLSISGLGPRVP